MPWTDAYIGIPFREDGRDCEGVDCGGLVILVYRDQLGIELPDYAGTLKNLTPFALRRASHAIKAELARWRRVDKPQPFDVVAFRRGQINACHVGIIINRTEMLHASDTTDVCVEHFNSLNWRPVQSGFFRYDR